MAHQVSWGSCRDHASVPLNLVSFESKRHLAKYSGLHHMSNHEVMTAAWMLT